MEKNEEIVGCTEQGTTAKFNQKNKKYNMEKIQENSEVNYGFKLTYGKPKSIYFLKVKLICYRI